MNMIKKLIKFIQGRHLKCEDCAHYHPETKYCYADFIGPDGRLYGRGFLDDGSVSFGDTGQMRKGWFTICGVFARDFIAKEDFYEKLSNRGK